MSALPLETATAVSLNIALLFLVSIEPYLLSLVNIAEAVSMLDYASIVYALDLAGLMAILGLFTHMLTIEERRLVPTRLIGQQRRNRNAFFLSTFLYLISTLPQFLAWRLDGTPLRVIFWYVPLIIMWSIRASNAWGRSR
jgi:hypothetical protein